MSFDLLLKWLPQTLWDIVQSCLPLKIHLDVAEVRHLSMPGLLPQLLQLLVVPTGSSVELLLSSVPCLNSKLLTRKQINCENSTSTTVNLFTPLQITTDVKSYRSRNCCLKIVRFFENQMTKISSPKHSKSRNASLKEPLGQSAVQQKSYGST